MNITEQPELIIAVSALGIFLYLYSELVYLRSSINEGISELL